MNEYQEAYKVGKRDGLNEALQFIKNMRYSCIAHFWTEAEVASKFELEFMDDLIP